MSVKLPESGSLVLGFPFASPTGYGLGKSGWVSLQFGSRDRVPPLEVLCAWIEESYRAVAPVRMAKTLGKPQGVSPRTKQRRRLKRARSKQ